MISLQGERRGPVSIALVATSLLAGGAISAVAWLPEAHGFDGQIAFVGLLPLLWLACASRAQSFFAVLGYFLFADRCLPEVVSSYTGWGELSGLTVALVHVLLMTAIWTMAWTGHPWNRLFRLCLVMALTTLPPLGAIAYASPLLAAGWLFPGMGLLGGALLLLAWCICFSCARLMVDRWHYRATSYRRWDASWPPVAVYLLPVLALVLLVISVVVNRHYQPPSPPAGWFAVSTQLGKFPDRLEARYERHAELIRLVDATLAKAEVSLVMLPEEIGGFWEPRYEWMWLAASARHPGKTIAVGFDVASGRRNEFTDQALFLRDGRVIASAAAAIPVPIGSWRPWSSPHAPMQFLDAPLVKIDGRRAVAVFCYEELLLWPWLLAHAQGNDPLALVFVNHWFSRSNALGFAQSQSSQAWARLFGWHTLRAVNGRHSAP